MYAGRVVEQRRRSASCSATRSIPTRGACWGRSRGSTGRAAAADGDPRPAAVAARAAAGLQLRARAAAHRVRPLPQQDPALEPTRRRRATWTPACSDARAEARRRTRAIHGGAGMSTTARSRSRCCGRATSASTSRSSSGVLFQREVARVHAVDGVSLDSSPVRRVGLVGESGCGKSTLGPLPDPAARPDRAARSSSRAGTSRTLGRDQLRPLRREMQMVFQDPYASLNPRKRVGTIIARPDAHPRRGQQARDRRRGCRSC